MSEEQNIGEDNKAEGVGYKEEILPSTASDEKSTQQNKIPLSSTLNPPPSTSNMEVHKHPHHVTHKKKWGEYFLEFFMLFLAVFLGFIAENIRENVVERHREKEFMSSMARDLELDTIQFSAIRKYNANKLKLADSVIAFFGRNSNSKIPAKIYRNAFELIKGGSFYQNSGTMEQLKNSGGLRLITKRIVVDSIQGYDQTMRRLLLRDKFEVDESVKNIDLLQKLFDGQSLSRLFVDSMYNRKQPDIINTVIALNSGYLSEYLNHLIEYRFLIFEDMKLRDQIASRAANVLKLIKTQYHLDSE